MTLMTLTPMLATERAARWLVGYLDDDRYAFQRKLDGHRVLIEVDKRHGLALSVRGRDGQSSQHHHRLSTVEHTRSYGRLPADYVVLDGELVDGVVWLFDIVVLDSHVLSPVRPSDPFERRSVALAALFANWGPPDTLFRLLPTAFETEAKAALALECVRGRAEGVVVRVVDGHYLSGRRSPAVLKFKFVHEADLVVMALGHEGKKNATLGAIFDGSLTEVGRASTLGKGDLQVGDVVLVRYQYFTLGGRLYGPPRIIRRRTDKSPAECTFDQLVTGGERA